MEANKPGSGRSEEAAQPETALDGGSEGGDQSEDATVRQHHVQQILDDADRRDDKATARDVASNKRDVAADLEAFLDPGDVYTGLVERRAAAVDRSHGKDDREAAADDRSQLTTETTPPPREPRPADG